VEKVYKVVIGLLLILIVILSLKECNSDPIIKTIVKKEYIKGKEIVVHEIDTIQTTTERIVYRNLQPIEHDRMDLSDTNVFNRTFVYPIKDSLLKASITINSEVRPSNVDFDYKMTFPTIIEKINTSRVDTLKITEETIKRTNQMYFGGELVVKPLAKEIFLGLDFVEKHGHQVELGVGYDLTYKTPLIKVGYKKLISFRK